MPDVSFLSRRHALSLMGLLAAGLAVPGFGAPSSGAATRGGLAPRLREGARLGLVAPAGFVADRFGVEAIEASVKAMGLEPVAAPHLLARDGYLAGDDATRARDFMAMFTDPQIDAVMAVRGGWGSARLLPYLDYAALARNPKLLIGSSDITALHMAFAAHVGVPSIHGPNAAASWPPAAWNAFRAIAFEGASPTYTLPETAGGGLGRPPALRLFRGGTARGRLLGGNLSVLSALVGTPYLPDFEGAILFLEDTNEAEYRIDRMLTQLALAGILGKVAGVVFGQCTNCRNPGQGYGNLTVYEVLDRHFRDLGVPAFQGAMIGHIAAQVAVPVGVMAEIDADAGTIRMLAPAVS